MKAFLQNVACHILQETAQEERHHKGRANRGFQRGQALYDNGNQCRSGAVDRKPRAGHKTAIDEAVKLKIFQCDLHAPAEKRIGKKQQYQVYQVFRQHIFQTPPHSESDQSKGTGDFSNAFSGNTVPQIADDSAHRM